MERPSHAAYRTTQPFSRRLIALGLAASFPVAVLWGLASGMGGHVTQIIRPLVYVHPEDPVEPKTPPLPSIEFQKVDRMTAQKPEFEIQDSVDHFVPHGGNGGAVVTPSEPLPTGPDRAAISVASTHTIPPYPILAQRMNAEGKVTLRLTVLTDGTVGMAQIVTSSGRADLDEAARDWIVRHWTYQPALDEGRPVISHVVASIVFRLTNAR